MRATTVSIVAVLAALLIGSLFVWRTTLDRTANEASSPDASPTDDMPSKSAGTPSADSASSTDTSPLASRTPVTGHSSAAGPTGLAAGAASETPAVESYSTMPVSAVVEKPDAYLRGGSVAAECWALRGDGIQDYVVTIDRDNRTSGEASALISSQRATTGYATMFQTTSAAAVRGKRVEFSADVRTRGAVGSANLLLRAEDANGRTVAFDNMQSYVTASRLDRSRNRGVRGDSDWSTQHVVLDIPAEAAVITYGLSMFNGGKAWIDNARIEVVSTDMATTAPDFRQQPARVMPFEPESLARSPKNLGFDLEAPGGASNSWSAGCDSP
jgi:hypothetical protein